MLVLQSSLHELALQSHQLNQPFDRTPRSSLFEPVQLLQGVNQQ